MDSQFLEQLLRTKLIAQFHYSKSLEKLSRLLNRFLSLRNKIFLNHNLMQHLFFFRRQIATKNKLADLLAEKLCLKKVLVQSSLKFSKFKEILTMQKEALTKVSKKMEKYKSKANLNEESLIETRGNIRVFIRIKPILSEETPILSQISVTKLKLLADNKLYAFDNIYQNENNKSIYSDLKPFVSSFFRGFNLCVFSYGQTGSGKTFTMEGNRKDLYEVKRPKMSIPLVVQEGLVTMAIKSLLKKAEKENKVETCIKNIKFTFSALEIHKEKFVDLLETDNENKKIEIKFENCPQFDSASYLNTKNAGFEPENFVVNKNVLKVSGLVEKKFVSYQDFDFLFRLATKNKKVGATEMNKTSSRSHVIYMVKMTKSFNTQFHKKQLESVSNLLLVDLAGSERVKKSEVSGEAFKESVSINSSLSTLSKVLSGLANKQMHIPFRDSKLTMLLKGCLNNEENDKTFSDGRVIVFCHLSNEKNNEKETKCTLSFASRTKNIDLGKLNTRNNEEDGIIEKKKLIKSKNNEIERLKATLEVERAKREVLESKLETLKKIKMEHPSKADENLKTSRYSNRLSMATFKNSRTSFATGIRTPKIHSNQPTPFKNASNKLLIGGKTPKPKRNTLIQNMKCLISPYKRKKGLMEEVPELKFDAKSKKKKKRTVRFSLK